jgi:hypothetical protein
MQQHTWNSGSTRSQNGMLGAKMAGPESGGVPVRRPTELKRAVTARRATS